MLRWPEREGPFGAFDSFGWQWQQAESVDANLLTLASVVRFNCIKVKGHSGGRCGAVLCRPPRYGTAATEGLVEIEILGMGVNAPPRFVPAHWLAADRAPQEEVLGTKIHAEMQIVGRCARHGIALAGAWAYVALPPCWECFKGLIAAGVSRMVFTADYTMQPDHHSKVKVGTREELFARASGVDWVPMAPCKRREARLHLLWERWKARNGMDRAAIKALATEHL